MNVRTMYEHVYVDAPSHCQVSSAELTSFAERLPQNVTYKEEEEKYNTKRKKLQQKGKKKNYIHINGSSRTIRLCFSYLIR